MARKIRLKMMVDTSAPKMDTLMKIKRAIGDTAEQKKKAEAIGLSSDEARKKLLERMKQKKQ